MTRTGWWLLLAVAQSMLTTAEWGLALNGVPLTAALAVCTTVLSALVWAILFVNVWRDEREGDR